MTETRKMSLPAAQSPFSLEDLRLLAVLGETMSLSAAARRLGVNHANAWRRLGALERRLGARLFERARAGYAPTQPGETAIATATRLIGELDGLSRLLAGEDLRPSGIVRVTTTDTLVDLLTPLLADFRRAHQGIVIELAPGNAFATLTRRDADVAIRPSAEAPEGLVARRLATLATAPYAAASVPLAEADWVAPDDTLSHLASARWLAAQVPNGRIVYRASSLLALAAAARAGLGAALLPCCLGDRDPGLIRLGGPMPELDASLWLMTHPDLRRAVRIRAFLDFMKPRIDALRPALEGRLSRTERSAGSSSSPPAARG